MLLSSTKTCNKCNQEKSIDDFGFENKKQGIKKRFCFDCDRARQREFYYRNRTKLLIQKKEHYEEFKPMYLERQVSYRKENKQKVKESFDKWFQKNPDAIRAQSKKRKALLRGAGIKLVTRKEIKRLLSQKCFYCETQMSTQVDHVIPVSRGGTHSIGNLVGACASCNASKNKWFITEWKKLKKERGPKF